MSIYIYLSTYLYVYIYAIYALNTLVTSVVLYSLTRATLMSPGQDETHVGGYIYIDIYIYIYINKYIIYIYICNRNDPKLTNLLLAVSRHE